MSAKQLHPSVQQFKEFVKSNPKIVMEVRKGNANWQDLYEEWYLLGENDPRWDGLKENGEGNVSSPKESEKKEWIPQILGAVKSMDANQLQGHIHSLSQALGAVQGLLTQFQQGNQSGPASNSSSNEPQHPFQFRKD